MSNFARRLVALVLLCATTQSQAVIIEFTNTNIADNLWQYDYTLVNDSATLEIEEFAIFYDRTLYSSLTIASSPLGWDTIAIQPDLNIPDDGFVDSLALGSALQPGGTLSGLSVQFLWLGIGLPGTQPFSVIDPESFEPIEGGSSTPSQSVPEPGTGILLAAAILACVLLGRKKSSRKAALASTISLACLAPLAAQAQTSQLDLVSSTRVSRTTFDYVYRLRFPTTGGDSSVGPYVMRIVSVPAGVTVIDGEASFAWFPPNVDAVSSDTITLRQDRTVPFAPSEILWRPFIVGRFRDSSVSGLSYSYAGGGGVTDSLGRYTMPTDTPVRFHVGAVTLGTVSGSIDELSPATLVAGGTATNTQVLNLARFLLMLDANGNADDGIQISSAVRTAAAGWAQPNFATTNLPSELAAIVVAAQAADGGAHLLPTAAFALTHLRNSYYCMRSGVYVGSYTAFFPDTATGRSAVVARPNSFGVGFYIYVTPDNRIDFISGGSPGHDDALNGSATTTFNLANEIAQLNATWFATTSLFSVYRMPFPSRIGSMTTSRPAYSPARMYRFTGSSNDRGAALFELHLPALSSGTAVSGFVYLIETGAVLNITGTLVGNTLTASAGSTVTMNGTLTTGPGTPTFQGTLNLNGTPRTYFAEGCLDN